MNIHINSKYLLLIILLFTGCASVENDQHSMLIDHQMELDEPTESQADIRDYSLYAPLNNHKKLNDYVQQMIMDFELTAQLSNPIGIASFVEFDETLTKTNSLGNQLAEAFLIEMSRAGYPVADINASGRLQINADGNFAFTRHQQKEFNGLCCALSGNLIYQSNGVLVNSKVFDIQTKKIYAASSLIIPYFVIDHLGQAKVR